MKEKCSEDAKYQEEDLRKKQPVKNPRVETNFKRRKARHGWNLRGKGRGM